MRSRLGVFGSCDDVHGDENEVEKEKGWRRRGPLIENQLVRRSLSDDAVDADAEIGLDAAGAPQLCTQTMLLTTCRLLTSLPPPRLSQLG